MRGNSKNLQRKAEKNGVSHAGVRKRGRHIKMKKFADFEYDENDERIFKTRVVSNSKTSRTSSATLKKKKLEVAHTNQKKRTARNTRITSKHVTQESQKCVDISKTKSKGSRESAKLSCIGTCTEDDDTNKAVAKTDKNVADVEGKIEDCTDEVEVKVGDLKKKSPRTAGAALPRGKRNLKRKKDLKKGKKDTDESAQSSEQVFNCSVCDEVVVGKNNFNQHKKCHKQTKKQKVFQCSFEGCTKEFRDSSNMRKHENSVHLNIRKFLCEFCVAQFKTSSCLKTHITAYHTRKEDRENFTCNICNKTFLRKISLTQHASLHTNIKSHICSYEGCGKSFRLKETLTKHISAVHKDEKPYECNICWEKFSRKTYLETHMYKHTGIKSFSCEVCGKYFSQKGNLKVHMLLHNKDRPVFKCPECFQIFNFKSNLTKHQQTKHLLKVLKIEDEETGEGSSTNMDKDTGTKNFSCDECGKYFSQMGNLRAHMLLHNKDRPASKCPECFQTFSFKSDLIRHQQTAHLANIGKTGAGISGEGSSASTAKGKNIKINKGTDNKKNYRCLVCGEQFPHEKLQEHLLLHEKKRPVFHCPECFQKFNFKSELTKHQQTKHPEYAVVESGTELTDNMSLKIQPGKSSDREPHKAIDLSNKRKKTETEMENITAPHKFLVTSAMERNKNAIIIVVKHFNDSNNDFCEKPLEEINHEPINVEKDENEVNSSPFVLVTTQQSSNGHMELGKEMQLNNDQIEISFQAGKTDNQKVYLNTDSELHETEPKAVVTARNNYTMAPKIEPSNSLEEFLSSGSAADSVAEKNGNNSIPDKNANCAFSECTNEIVNEAGVDCTGTNTDGNLQNSEMMPSDNLVYKETSYLTLQPSEGGADDKVINFHQRVKEAKQDSDLGIEIDTSGVSDSNKSIKVQTLRNPEYFDINELIVKEQVESEIPVENF